MTDLTDEELERKFRALADQFIDAANTHAANEHKENVGLALLYAAARFNAFVVASHAGDLDGYQEDLDKAKEYFTGEYRRMLEENLEDYKSVFRASGPYAHLVKPGR